MPLVNNNGSSSLLEIYDYIGDCITGRDKEIIDWEREFIDKKKVRDAIDENPGWFINAGARQELKEVLGL